MWSVQQVTCLGTAATHAQPSVSNFSAEYQDPFQHHAHPVYSTTVNSVFRTLPRNMLVYGAMVNFVFRTFCTNTLVYVTALDSVFRKLCVMTHIYSRAVNSVFS